MIVYDITKHEVLISDSLGLCLWISHKTSAAKNAPTSFITKNISSPTHICSKGFPSRANLCVTRNLLTSPSETTRAISVPRRSLIR